MLTLDRSANVGMCILDLSKTLMYDLHYNYIKSKCSGKAKSLFTDTDSLCYEIEAGDCYMDSRRIKSYLTIVIAQKIINIMMPQTSKPSEKLQIRPPVCLLRDLLGSGARCIHM